MRWPLAGTRRACSVWRTLLGVPLLIFLLSETNAFVPWNGALRAGANSFFPISSRLGPRRDGLQVLSIFSKQNGESSDDARSKPEFYIRKAAYSDLGVVSDIIMSSFYTGENARSPWRQMFQLGELNRLQQNFPYNDDKHSMLVAIYQYTEQVIAFVDIDARPPKRQQDPPRPYLSDLAVDPCWRRNGIARSLIENCELLAQQMGTNEIFIRVEQNNTSAISMYEALNYEAQAHEYFGVADTTILLNKKLPVAVDRNCTGDDTQPVLDYVL